tara:strand:- start:174 stop:470 length:297 start_codon:yes stop_codon:yes gene_type:complete
MKSKGNIMNRRKKVFNKIVNPLLLKYLAPTSESAIAKNIPIKYLNYFKEITGSGNGMKIRYRYRGSTGYNMNAVGGWYDRPQSFCHLEGASTFAIYER